MAKADHRDAYMQLLLQAQGELSASVTLRNPSDNKLRGSNPKTQLFWSAVALLRDDCFSSAVAPSPCRESNLPRIGYCEDFGIVTQKEFIRDALGAFTRFSDPLDAASKTTNPTMAAGLNSLELRSSSGNPVPTKFPRPHFLRRGGRSSLN